MDNQHQQRRAFAYGLSAVALWSTVATGFKLGLQIMAPAQLLLIGTCISTAIFWAAALRTGQTRLTVTGRKHALLFALINPFAYYLVLFEAYDRLPAHVAQPLNYTWAIVLAILAVPWLGQRLSLRTTTGIGVGYAGVLVLLSQGNFTRMPSTDWLGVGLALFSTLLWAGYWLMNTRTREPPVALMAWSFLYSLPLLAIACAIGPGLPRLSVPALAYGAWVGCIELGFTFLLWQQALRLTDNAARIGQLIFLAPFLSFAMIATVLGEAIHFTSIVGLAIIVTGLFITRTPQTG
ncbi:MAG: DMT family transporter [Pseudomonadales bacterium]|jgi:drug/metabolite transporter (DMT)-like permease|nr:DMT family transporter [Pseudomonadales bacterium]MDP6470514.1 DMT family transporter [Pseudomonadales bacterium]MDP6827816.1 DMT family transporter [Pseudomonadales bacterium]MDP6972988.1 DMT family transporter [Pseudomonadales bacterium]|tara:strand:+ start:1846 stop:2724 length:879 start_codon:yes stop_codon:yes gene_type:complete